MRRAQRGDVPLVVVDVRHRVRHELKAHVLQVGVDQLLDARREGRAVLVQLLHGERADHLPLMALHGAVHGVLDFVARVPEEVLRRELHLVQVHLRAVPGQDLDLRGAAQRDAHALGRFRAPALHGDGHELEAEPCARLENPELERALADDDARAAAPGDDRGLVGRRDDDVTHGWR